jgi:uncharacterized membrane protein
VAALRTKEFTMTHQKRRLRPLAVATIVAVFTLAACQDRKPTEAQAPAASSGEYPTPSDAAPSSTSGAGSGSTLSSDGRVDGKK